MTTFPLEEEVYSIFSRLKNQLQRLPERIMRREIFGEGLCRLPSAIQAQLLYLIIENSPTCSESTRLLVAFQDQPRANHQLDYQQKRALYEEVKKRGYSRLQELILSASAPPPSSNLVIKKQDDSALGMRKFMARKLDPLVLSRLLSDPDPSVIKNILNNPRITEREVLRICSKRPCPSDVLLEVSCHSRWFQRYHVKLALAQNPYTPHSVAVQALPNLLTPDLQRISQMRNLPSSTIAKAQEILEYRKPSGKP